MNQRVQTDRTVPNNQVDIKIRDNGKETRMLTDVTISGHRNVIKKEAEDYKIQRLCSRNKVHVERKNKSDTNHNGGKWKNLKII